MYPKEDLGSALVVDGENKFHFLLASVFLLRKRDAIITKQGYLFA